MKASKNSCHVSFLKCCRDFNLTPKGLRLKNPVKTERSKAIISKAQSLLLTSELNGHKSTFSSSSKELKLSLDILKTVVSDTDYECIMRLNNIKANAIMVNAIKKHSKKFHQLLHESSLHLTSPYTAFLQHIDQTPRVLVPHISGPLRDTKPHPEKKSTVVNLSNETLTPTEVEVLNLGLKFTPSPMNDPATDIASRVQPAIRDLPSGMQSSIAHDISHILLNPPPRRDNLQRHQRTALKNLKAKKQRLKILPADKGNATVVLLHNQYHTKLPNILLLVLTPS